MMFMQAVLTHPRLERQRALFALAAGQRGYFTASQARGLGYAYQVQQHHRESGNWSVVPDLRGVYRLRDYPDDTLERLVQISLWSANERNQPQGVIGFATALMVYHLGGLLQGGVHLVVPRGFRKVAPADVTLHRTPLEPADVVAFEGFAVTTVLRTLCDLAASDLSLEHLESAVRDAINSGQLRRSTLEQRVSSLPARAAERMRDALEGSA